MKKYDSHGGTDITGFGLLGHAKNLANVQKNDVDLVIESIPVIDQMSRIIDGMHDFKVPAGYSAETSGGILTMIDPALAEQFIADAKEIYKQEAWVVGKVVTGTKQAIIVDDVKIIEVTQFLL